ncbi:MAG: glycosyltransferase family 4 protein [Nanoarchaeota archaeon]|nr:glycosyltransferase family 4 protein [Nanoarchaeota archaeon]
MKVLITHELFMPDFAGGGEKLVYEMAKNLQKRGIQVKVLTTGNPKIKSFEGIPTVRLKINRYLMNFAFFSIWKHAKDVDLIQTSNYNACFPSWLVGKLLRKPVVCFVFGLYGKRWLKMRGFFKGTVSRIVEKIQLNRSYDKILFLSDYSKEWGREVGVAGKNSMVINPGVDLKDYKSGKKESFVLFSGRFAKQKGVYDLIKVAKLLPHINFVMMGWGEEEGKLREIAPTNVKFSNLSLKAGKPFFEMYSKASVFFLPSYGETFGFVLVEAMASGCPIVSTIPLGFEGLVVKPGRVRQMAKAIDYLMSNSAKAKVLGKKNVELAQRFTWSNFADKLVGLYENIL